MNKNTCDFIGWISQVKPEKVRNKKSPRYGNSYYRLQVDLPNQENISEVLALSDFLEDKSIFVRLSEWKINKKQQKYLFTCQRKPGAGQVWRLINWKELNQ